MGEAPETRRMTAAEYLAWEREQPGKHEFKDGEVFAMAGGTPRHAFLSVSVASALHVSLRPKGCHVMSSDMRITARAERHFVYADAVVACGRMVFEEGTTDVLANPVVIVEVLSKGTEAYDRGEKWEAYQRLASLTDYLLVSQGSARIEHYQRSAESSAAGEAVEWRYREVGPHGTVVLANGATLSVDAIYDGAFELDAG